MSASRWITASATVAAALAVAGCVSLLPAGVPAQLYRFGAGTPGGVAPQAADIGRRTGVLLDGVLLTRAASSDQLLTVAGNQVAYVERARWAEPASQMFTEAVQRAFDDRAQRVRLQARGGLGKTTASLRLFVRDFQADYGSIRFPDAASKGRKNGPPPNLPAPTAVVSVRARLAGADGQLIAERDFAARRPTSDNRIGAIVPAMDAAVGEVLTQVVAWTDANTPSLGPAGR